MFKKGDLAFITGDALDVKIRHALVEILEDQTPYMKYISIQVLKLKSPTEGSVRDNQKPVVKQFVVNKLKVFSNKESFQLLLTRW